MFPNSYSFNPGVVLDPVTMTPMIGGSSFTVNPFGVPAKPQQKVWQKMFVKEIPVECSNQNMIKLLKQFGDVKNYKRSNSPRGEPLPFCFFDLETGQQILRLKRLFKNIRLLDKTLQIRISPETENFLKQWTTIQKDEWRKKLLTPELNQAKQFDTIQNFFQKDDHKYKQRIEDKLRQINSEVKKIAIERLREQQKKQHPKQKEREKKKKRALQELDRSFHQQQDYWIKRQRGKVKHLKILQDKEYRREKEKQKEREKAKIRRLQRQMDLDQEEEEKRIAKFLNPERIKMIDKEQEEDLLALEQQNPPLPDEDMPMVQQKKSRFYLGEELKLGQETVKEVVVKMQMNNSQMDEEKQIQVNEMFKNWDQEKQNAMQEKRIDLKLPEIPQANQQKQLQLKKKIQELEEQVPKNKRDLWEYPIDWDLLSKSVVLIKNIKPWLQQQSYEYMGSMQEKFVALVQKKIFSRSHPDKIIKIISQLIDDDAEEFVIKLWKKIVLQYLKLKNGIIQN